MRMREGWEVWLLPNQATGKQGVPRYIKVDSAKETATDSEEAATTSGLDPTEPEGSLEQVKLGFATADVFFCAMYVPSKSLVSGRAFCCLLLFVYIFCFLALNPGRYAYLPLSARRHLRAVNQARAKQPTWTRGKWTTPTGR